ncbi:MAG: hypothetical protein N2114_06460 [Candidatus Goldbacteria bacterium]|nr:hypothetical protein [Candidatus Goldiibacteriota bacterium]
MENEMLNKFKKCEKNKCKCKVCDKLDKKGYPLSVCEYCNTLVTIELNKKNAKKWTQKIEKREEFNDGVYIIDTDAKTIDKAIKNNIKFEIVEVFDVKNNMWCSVLRGCRYV